MKSRSVSYLSLGAALAAPALLRASSVPAGPAIGYFASRITVNTWSELLERLDTRSVVDGSSREEVVSAMGRPAGELSPDIWMYDHYRPDLPEARAQGCTILVVTFARDRVVDMKFVNRPAAGILASNLRRDRVALAR